MYFSAYNHVCQCPSKIVGIPPLPRQSADLLPIPRGKFIISFIMTSTNPPSASHISYTIPGTPPASVPPKLTHPPLLPPLELPLPHPSKSTRWPSVFSQVLLALPSSLFQPSVQQRSTPRVMHDLKYHYFPTPGKLVKRKQRKSSTYLPGWTVVEIGMLHVVEKEFVHEMLNCFF